MWVEDAYICEDFVHRSPEAAGTDIESCICGDVGTSWKNFSRQLQEWWFDYNILAYVCEEFCKGVPEGVVPQMCIAAFL